MGCLFIFSLLLIIIVGIVVGNIYGLLYGLIIGFGLLILYAIIIWLQHWWVDIRGLNIWAKKQEEKKKERERKYLVKTQKYLEERKIREREINISDMMTIRTGDRIELIHDSRFYIDPGATGTVIKVEVPFKEMKNFNFKEVFVEWDKEWGVDEIEVPIEQIPLIPGQDEFEVIKY